MSLLWKRAAQGEIHIYHSELPHGGRLTAHSPGEDEPRGVLDYYHHSPEQVGVEYVTVHRPYRRQGLASHLLDTLRELHPGKGVVTEDFTRLGDRFNDGYRRRTGTGMTALSPGEWFGGDEDDD